MFVCARDIVARTPDFDILTQNMTLRPWQWEMLHSFDDHTSLGAIARRIGVDLASITESLSALEQHGLIKIRTVTREEYRRVFEMTQPGQGAPSAPDDEDDAPVGRAPVETVQLKPIPSTGEPLSVRLEALRAKAEQAQAARPPSADTVPFQGQAAPPAPPPAAPPVTPTPTAAEIDIAASMVSSAAVSAAQAPPEPPPAADGFSSKLADLKARLDQALAPPVETPTVEPPKAADPEAEEPAPARGGLADFTDALAGPVAPAESPAPVYETAPAAKLETNYAPVTTNGNGTPHTTTIAFSLSNEPAPKPALSPDAIEFSLGGPSSTDDTPPKLPPLKY
jgi:hypothetical protein